MLQALKMKGKSDNEAMIALIDMVVEHVRKRRAFLVVTPDQTFKPPQADDSAFMPGSPYIDEPKSKHLHMNVIFPRRDLVALIKSCCPLIPGHTQTCFVNYKAVFTTAATQTYAGLPSTIPPPPRPCFLPSHVPDLRPSCQPLGRGP